MTHDDVQVQVHNADQPNIIPSPEKKLMMFVATMAMLELMASWLGMVRSLWATVMLPKNYLGFITLMLLFEGIHIFCNRSKLVLYHIHNMQQLPNPICFMSWLFYWLELISVITSGVLSVMGLVTFKREEALVFCVFYVMTISEVLVFLAAKAIWKWEVSYCRLLEKVKDAYGLDNFDMDLIKTFFYDMHSKCVEDGSIIDALKMDPVTFAGKLLVSNLDDEQLMAASFLKALALSTHPHLSDAVLRKIGTSKVVIEQLIQMLNSKNLFEENIGYSAAVIVSKLADKEPNVLRVAGMDEEIKSANYLLGAK